MKSAKENPEEVLDAVLRYLDNEEQYQETVDQIKERGKFQYSLKDMFLTLDKLSKDGYANFGFTKSGGVPTENKTFYITFHGRLFLKRGGYQNESITLKRNSNWTVVKTVVAVLNAITILAIAFWGVLVSKESKLKDEQINKLETVIDSIQAQKIITPNVQVDSTSNKPDSLNSN